MQKLHIEIRTKTKLIQELESIYDIEYYKEQSFFEKLILKDKKQIDIYFHQGVINDNAIKLIGNSSQIIVNSNNLKDTIIKKIPYMRENKINIIYPLANISIKYNKQIKKDFRNKYNIHKDERIIYFTGKDLKISGLNKFLKIITGLDKNNFKILIDTDSSQIERLTGYVNKLNLIDKFILLENYLDKDKLFIISDIFVLPTKQKLFAPNVLRAMYLRNAVFIMRSNSASELIDSFSLILSEDDPSTSFKIDALLSNKKELKSIQQQNYKIAKNHTLSNNIKRIEEIVENIFDI